MTYFKTLYNSVSDNHDRDYVVKLSACSEVDKDVFECISISDVINAIHGLKTGKSAGPIGLVSESFMNSGMKLCVHLSLLYTLCIRHGYLPSRLMDINIIPLVKNKCGDTTDINNYRAIALCNVETKILEKIILSKVL